jgi:hypothetical protein
VTFYTLTRRLDGQGINRGPSNGSTVIGVEPVILWRFSDAWVGAVGVLFMAAGQNTLDAFYPNFSVQMVLE